MDYFLVKADLETGVTAVIQPFADADNPMVQMADFDENQCFLDLYQSPAWLFSERLKGLLGLYDPELCWSPFALVDSKRKVQKLYFQTKLPVIDCVSDQSKFTLNKQIRRFVLKRTAIAGRHLFIPALEKETHLIVSLPLAESILRRPFYGICLQRIADFEGE